MKNLKLFALGFTKFFASLFILVISITFITGIESQDYFILVLLGSGALIFGTIYILQCFIHK